MFLTNLINNNNMYYKITDYNQINNKIIDDEIFNKEKVNYEIIDKDSQIDHLIDWIAKTNSESDKFLMKEDLKYLIGLPDNINYILSSINTNEYYTEKDKDGQAILKEIYNFKN